MRRRNECPDDPIEKQRYLAANAIAQLVVDQAHLRTGIGDDLAGDHTAPTARPKPGRPEYVMVIDADADNRSGTRTTNLRPAQSGERVRPLG